jgi:hypothetical protein
VKRFPGPTARWFGFLGDRVRAGARLRPSAEGLCFLRAVAFVSVLAGFRSEKVTDTAFCRTSCVGTLVAWVESSAREGVPAAAGILGWQTSVSSVRPVAKRRVRPAPRAGGARRHENPWRSAFQKDRESGTGRVRLLTGTGSRSGNNSQPMRVQRPREGGGSSSAEAPRSGLHRLRLGLDLTSIRGYRSETQLSRPMPTSGPVMGWATACAPCAA